MRKASIQLSRILFISVLLILNINANAQISFAYQDGGEEYVLKGQVKTVKERRYPVDENLQKTEAPVFFFGSNYNLMFTRDGVLLEREVFSYENKLAKKLIYNVEGQPIKKFKYFPSGKLEQYEEFSYSSFNKLLNYTKTDSLNQLIAQQNYSYNSDEKLTSYTFFGFNNEIESSSSFRYDDEGRLIEHIQEGTKNSSKTKRVYFYDGDGNMYESNEYNSQGEVINKTLKSYDSSGNEIESLTYGSGYSFLSKSKFEYDQQNRLQKEINFGRDGYPTKEITKEYNSKNDVIRIQKDFYHENGEHYERIITEFDDFGRKIKEFEFDKEMNVVVQFEEIFDAEGNSIKRRYLNKNNGLESTFLFTYENGFVKTEEFTQDRFHSGNSETSIYSYQYEFDEFGNWTNRVSFKDGVPTFVSERYFEYY